MDEVLQLAENDPDPQVQNYALTWAMNPVPPRKMPNSKSRIELQESVPVRQLLQRVKAAKSPKLRQLYLRMISRASCHEDDDYRLIRAYYGSLDNDADRALVLVPLSKSRAPKELLWQALRGDAKLRQAAVRGLVESANLPQNSPEAVANFLLSKLSSNGTSEFAESAIEAISRLRLAMGWQPMERWGGVWIKTYATNATVETRERLLRLLVTVNAEQCPEKVVSFLKRAAMDVEPRLFAAFLGVKNHLNLDVDIPSPEIATVEAVLAKLSKADPASGKEVFFKSSATLGASCVSCHRVDGTGNNYGPDLSGIGIRADAKAIAESIVAPGATIIEGFQLQLFETSSGPVLGVVLKETDSDVEILKADGSREMINAQSISSRTKLPQSVMPDAYKFLGSDQIADLVAFLMTLRHGES